MQEGEVGTLSYKLTLKEDYNKEIIDVILPTNEKVDITYEDNGVDKEATSPDAPTIVVKYQEPEKPPVNEVPEVNIPEENVDNTVAPDPIPQTGAKTLLFGATMIALVGYVGTRAWKIRYLNKK